MTRPPVTVPILREATRQWWTSLSRFKARIMRREGDRGVEVCWTANKDDAALIVRAVNSFDAADALAQAAAALVAECERVGVLAGSMPWDIAVAIEPAKVALSHYEEASRG